ncbi:BamA/OMP85 family outer membrane protein [Cesiribacter andamanensis]|uniref:Outer membrane protein omp85 n=1 Tax=Cesiribacter andamanensis AMV16 TaxID=1279009 RepID=M7N966_9BACT|nr:POTRA domain-containing protein [Cesiribacter andamanensis]EMR03746.1 Outer membrane protein omp85 precursor [Cesiribacter andamanensis AMV16]
MRRILLFCIGLALLPSLVHAQVGLRRQSRTQTSTELNYANPQEYEIADIAITGLSTLNAEALISLTGLRVGDRIRIPGDAITNAINKLWEQGIIGDAGIYITKTEGDRVWLEIALSERPRLSGYDVEGVSKTQSSDIKDQIKLNRGRVVTDALLKNTELNVRKYLIEKGYLNATVKITPEKDQNLSNSVRLRIRVDRGRKQKIDQINFVGNENLADSRLKGRMKKTKEKPRITLFQDLVGRAIRLRPSHIGQFFSNSREVDGQDIKDYLATHVKPNFFSSSKFVRQEFEEDKKSVIAFYNSKGYRDARIIGDTVYRSPKENRLVLDVQVEEGRKYYFRTIDWTGNYVHTDSTLSRILAIDKGDVYDMELIQKKLNYNPAGQDISSLYMDNGYLFFSIRPVEVKVEGDSIDVEMRIQEGPQATIKRIIVNGNERTKDHVIMREIRTLPGEKFSRTNVIRTQREILALGYFDQEAFGINPVPNPADGTVDIEYTVQEKPSDQIELSAGWGGRGQGAYGGFIGTLGLVFNNFSIQNILKPSTWDPLPVGDGQTLALRGQASGRRFQSYSFTFSEPWLGGKKPNSFSVNLSHSIQRYYNQTTLFRFDDQASGHLKVTNLSVGLGRRVKWPDDFFAVRNTLSYQIYNIYTRLDAEGNPVNNFNPGQIIGIQNGNANNITFNTTFSRNSVSAPIYPLNGSSYTLTASFTPPYSAFSSTNYSDLDLSERYRWVEYHKYMFDAETYTSVIGKLVLNTKANMGFIGSYGGDAPIGPFERFVLGGDGLSGQAAGFILGRDIIGLRGYTNNSITPRDQNGQMMGGIIYNKFALQLRYPVSLAPSATIYVQAFAEAGNNWASYSEYNPFKLYRSAGIGARIFMAAFGLIGIDWGYGFDQVPGQPDASGPQFHFTIGQQIR